LAETESIAENLSIALTKLSIKAKKAIKRVLILAGQLKEAFLFLMIIREEGAAIILRIGCTIYRLMTPRV
jgi:hypothetical protein